MEKYISLGYFCSVALELEKYGLRSFSSPFDWCISDFDGVILCLEEQFADFLNYDYLAQNSKEPAHYKNLKYNISFFHDFIGHISLDKQLKSVQEKYNRRICRFLKEIESPTLFIRYISDERKRDGKAEELIYIENNYQKILSVLKSFNDRNDILFIANEGVKSEIVNIYNVAKDENDIVARAPFEKNPYLSKKFKEVVFPQKEENISRYFRKDKERKKLLNRLGRMVARYINKNLKRQYIHEKQY